MAFLNLENLSKRFGDFLAVDGLNLEIQQGEFISLLGPSGCGKTTTLQMIAGLHEPTTGRIKLDGRDITHVAPNKRGLGIVFQSYALFPHMTVFGNVSFGLEMRGIAPGDRKERVLRSLAQVKLSEMADRYPRELSGGQRQRVALARALVIEPPILLLDEPLSNLDAKLREEMQLELRLLQQTIGVTTILVTHDQSEALSMSDRVVVMNEGRSVQIDSPFHMYEAPVDAFVSDFVGKTNLLEGVVIDSPGSATIIEIAGTRFEAMPMNLTAGTPVHVSLRPEKLTITEVDGADALKGRIVATVFHGDRWLYKMSTPMGDLIVTEANTGTEPRNRGDEVGIRWTAASIRVLPRD